MLSYFKFIFYRFYSRDELLIELGKIQSRRYALSLKSEFMKNIISSDYKLGDLFKSYQSIVP